MAYCSSSDIMARYSVTILGDLVTDSGIRANTTSLATDTNLQAALDDASGIIDSAVLVAGRYSPADLTALTGVDLAMLKRLTSDLAFILLTQRKGMDVKQLPQWQGTQDMLQLLRTGERIFNVAANIVDGNPTAEFPSCVTYAQVNLAAQAASRFFPIRRQQNIN